MGKVKTKIVAEKNFPETPLMKQFYEMKSQHPDAVLLFRCGDFYETYGDDAVRAADILGITLTKRSNKQADSPEMAGFPHHALDNYLPKLIRAGLRVAICDQLEDPKLAKKLVKRGITEVVTPSVSYNDNTYENKENSFLASIHFGANNMIGLAFLDISTGEFLTAEGNAEYADKLLNSFSPKEVIYEKDRRADFETVFGKKYYTFGLDEWVFNFDTSYNRLLKHFEVKNLKGFGVESLKCGIVAAGAVFYYLDQTHHEQTGHIRVLSRIEEDRYVWLDRFTTRNLELYGTLNDGGRTLLGVLDHTVCPMGARLLKRWIAFPLKDIGAINERLQLVEYLFKHPELKQLLDVQISQVGDLERIASKVAVGRVNPRELIQLRNALDAMEQIKEACSATDDAILKRVADQLNPCVLIRERIRNEIQPDPPLMVNRGNVIRSGVNAELDELREISYSGKDYLMKLQEKESERTGIPSLKISYNNVFGYYIEVRNTHKDKVPEDWIRKQTLVNAERYITQELKDYEEKILTAEEKILGIETTLFGQLVQALLEYISSIQLDAALVAQLDCLLSFAKVSEENRYIRPEVNDSLTIDIKQGRHPVIERQLPIGEQYVANDVMLDNESQQIIIITGPNMAGKSALLRQTALITLMAQIGCFVPAESAKIGVVDKIFTRVGASDNISAGESTFMVEMNEAACILNNISARSLILFDELGRGTSTYDGISIAWSIVEFLHENKKAHPKTLFATHYHELNEMEKTFDRIRNYNVSVKEIDKKVIFLRKLVRGGSEHSFGIHVAKMAGMPPSIIERADDILKQLESNNKQNRDINIEKQGEKSNEGYQLSFFQLDDPVLSQIRDEILGININSLTPIEALNKLNEIKTILTGKK